MSWKRFLLLLSISSFLGACSPAAKSIPMRLGGKTLKLELADTPQAWEKGLQGRRSLKENEGMLFVFPEARPLSFWSKNTPLPLSVAFLDENGKIVQIESLPPESTKQVFARMPSRYALEMNAGWFDKNGINVGDSLMMESR